jgi:thioredoxin 1
MNNFNQYINSNKLVLVDFFAEWCGPCKMMTPVLQEVKRLLGDHVAVIKMDIDKNPDYAASFNVVSVPTIMLFNHGKPVWRAAGVQAAHILVAEIKKHQF